MVLISIGLVLPVLFDYFYFIKLDKNVIEKLFYISNYLPGLFYGIEIQKDTVFFGVIKIYLFGILILTSIFSFVISAILFMKEKKIIEILLFAPVKSNKLIAGKLLSVNFIAFILILPVFLFGLLNIYTYFYNLHLSFKTILYMFILLYLVVTFNINISVAPALRVNNSRYFYPVLFSVLFSGLIIAFWLSFYKNGLIFLAVLDLILFNLNIKLLRV